MLTVARASALFIPAFKNIQGMVEKFVGSLPQLVVGLAAFWLALKTAQVCRKWAWGGIMKATKGDEEAAQVLGQVTYVAVIVAGVAVAAAIMGIGLGHVLAGLGVSGVVAGFAFKDILENFLAGILLLLTRPFQIGDVVKTNDFEGTVRAISTRSTIIETFDGLMVIVPNAKIYSQPLTNYSALPTRRTAITVRVAYDRNLDEIKAAVQDLIKKTPGVLDEPKPDILATNLEDLTVSLEIKFWTKRTDALSAKSALLAAVKSEIYADRPPPSAALPDPAKLGT